MGQRIPMVVAKCQGRCKMPVVATEEAIQDWPRCPFCGSDQVSYQPLAEAQPEWLLDGEDS